MSDPNDNLKHDLGDNNYKLKSLEKEPKKKMKCGKLCF
jgi:hypothetical protein